MQAELEFLGNALKEFRTYKGLADKAIAQISENEMHWQPNEESNSIAIIIRHMAGNMRSRWTDFLTTDGEKPDRYRDTEFIDKNESKDELIALWNSGWDIVFNTMESLKPEDALKTVLIRTEPHTVIRAIIRQIAHYGSHVGQIVYLAKQIKNTDWQTLSIPRGKSEEFNKAMSQK